MALPGDLSPKFRQGKLCFPGFVPEICDDVGGNARKGSEKARDDDPDEAQRDTADAKSSIGNIVAQESDDDGAAKQRGESLGDLIRYLRAELSPALEGFPAFREGLHVGAVPADPLVRPRTPVAPRRGNCRPCPRDGTVVRRRS